LASGPIPKTSPSGSSKSPSPANTRSSSRTAAAAATTAAKWLSKVAGQEKKFTVQDTDGFQKWKDVEVGEIEIKEPGTQRLVIDPVNKTKAAVLDVQKWC